MNDEIKKTAIEFLEYVMLENGVINERFSKEDKEVVEEDWNNFIYDKEGSQDSSN